jgi:hypothetical protein
MYTLYNTSAELNTRLAMAPQPVFHCNSLLASLAINSSPPLLANSSPGYKAWEHTGRKHRLAIV